MEMPASRIEAKLHKDLQKVSNQVDDVFLRCWSFPSLKAREKYKAAEYPKLCCYLYPNSLPERLIFPCMLFTLLFLTDDVLGSMSLEEGSRYYARLYPIASGQLEPKSEFPEELLMWNIWQEMRRVDTGLADLVLEPCFNFMRSQVSPERTKYPSFGEYLSYRLSDIGTAYSTPPRACNRRKCFANMSVGFHRLVVKMACFAMDLHLSVMEHSALLPLEENFGRHMLVINDICSYEREARAVEGVGQPEGAAICSAVLVLAGEAGLSVLRSKEALLYMCRLWELECYELMSELARKLGIPTPTIGRVTDIRKYLDFLQDGMAGNEAWSKETQRYEVATSEEGVESLAQLYAAATTEISRAVSFNNLHSPRIGSDSRAFARRRSALAVSPEQVSVTPRRAQQTPVRATGVRASSPGAANSGSPTPRRTKPRLQVDTTVGGAGNNLDFSLNGRSGVKIEHLQPGQANLIFGAPGPNPAPAAPSTSSTAQTSTSGTSTSSRLPQSPSMRRIGILQQHSSTLTGHQALPHAPTYQGLPRITGARPAILPRSTSEVATPSVPLTRPDSHFRDRPLTLQPPRSSHHPQSSMHSAQLARVVGPASRIPLPPEPKDKAWKLLRGAFTGASTSSHTSASTAPSPLPRAASTASVHPLRHMGKMTTGLTPSQAMRTHHMDAETATAFVAGEIAGRAQVPPPPLFETPRPAAPVQVAKGVVIRDPETGEVKQFEKPPGRAYATPPQMAVKRALKETQAWDATGGGRGSAARRRSVDDYLSKVAREGREAKGKERTQESIKEDAEDQEMAGREEAERLYQRMKQTVEAGKLMDSRRSASVGPAGLMAAGPSMRPMSLRPKTRDEAARDMKEAVLQKLRREAKAEAEAEAEAGGVNKGSEGKK